MKGRCVPVNLRNEGENELKENKNVDKVRKFFKIKTLDEYKRRITRRNSLFVSIGYGQLCGIVKFLFPGV